MILWHRWRRERILRQTKLPDELRGYLLALPLQGSIALDEQPLLAADLELTGLDATQHEIVSIGTVPLLQRGISLSGCDESLIRPEKGVGQSAVCHQLTDDELRIAAPIEIALLAFFRRATGKVLLFHHGQLDLRFLKQACRKSIGTVPPFVYIDTQLIEQQRRKLARPDIPLHQLRLPQCRHHYGLPIVRGHRALSDAVACAELLLAQLAEQKQLQPKLADYWQFA